MTSLDISKQTTVSGSLFSKTRSLENSIQRNQKSFRTEDNFPVIYRNRVFSFGQVDISFSRSRIKDKIMNIFLSAPNFTVEKEQLLNALYSEKASEYMSDRYYQCLCHNTIKSVSRCRDKISQICKNYYPEIFWFPYDSITSCWQLYRVIYEKDGGDNFPYLSPKGYFN